MPALLASQNEDVAELIRFLRESRKVHLPGTVELSKTLHPNLLHQIRELSTSLDQHGQPREAEAFRDLVRHCLNSTDFGGLGLDLDQPLSRDETAQVIFLASAYVEALNSVDRSREPATPLPRRPTGRRGMTLAEKIFAAHDVERNGEVKPGDVIRVDVDWVIASELSWSGMASTYDDFGKPGVFRNDRIWLAGDHVVDPRVMDHPKIKPLVEASEKARKVFKMTEYQGMNYTIMHTEFCRERAQPGMLIIGSDSHTCSAGSVSALAIGMGVADVTMPLVLGQTWFKIPETVEIQFINQPKPGLGGKDVILYVLKELKRNTVAADRVVEYTGPGVKYLSCDARFAIANMTTEFGGVSGIFVPDATTTNFINRRKHPKYRKHATYYQPDEDAEYAETHIIDLDKVESFVARYPSPDDVVPVADVAGTKLDGCFIGACTTAEEDLILAALVLRAGLKKGLKPVSHGKRKVSPGSRPILHNLKAKGLLQIYEEAGFEIGVPGCSYCVGMGADKAGKGEVWLSSQNRNFENRMGPGAIGSITSAVTVAASSFSMKTTDPRELLDKVDMKELKQLLGTKTAPHQSITYVHPASEAKTTKVDDIQASISTTSQESEADIGGAHGTTISGKVHKLEDFIDTDALAPAEVLRPDVTKEELGNACLKYTHSGFAQRVKDGRNIVVAGKAFGVGSSRENAVAALQAAGVQAVIAKSFAFIYGRNQPNLGMLGFVITDEKFHELAQDGKQIVIDMDRRKVLVAGQEFIFQLSDLEWQLVKIGGMTNAFRLWGKNVLETMTGQKTPAHTVSGVLERDTSSEAMQW
ncbi:unnamed protein product [Clonostachys rosea f. rosea IK726]|uniref:Aconitase/3-isopropylmalate dehydratase large subunit alpha/beta/alpha domain-containing protein n=2 Tax=Bionectria ochroleuca TaxID=29856 RepID=A0A0B7K455_BIOOC|nr:unnamed protein product [Clonostachys rosea f. rosea IK726]